jgi:hypothetical protein
MPNEPPQLSFGNSSPSHFMMEEDEEIKIGEDGEPQLP